MRILVLVLFLNMILVLVFFEHGAFKNDDDDEMWQAQQDEFFDANTTPAAGQAVFEVPTPAGQAVLKVSAPVFKVRKPRKPSQEGSLKFSISKKMTAIKESVLNVLKFKESYNNTKLKWMIKSVMRYWSELPVLQSEYGELSKTLQQQEQQQLQQ
jgi:hypothetical protein